MPLMEENGTVEAVVRKAKAAFAVQFNRAAFVAAAALGAAFLSSTPSHASEMAVAAHHAGGAGTFQVAMLDYQPAAAKEQRSERDGNRNGGRAKQSGERNGRAQRSGSQQRREGSSNRRSGGDSSGARNQQRQSQQRQTQRRQADSDRSRQRGADSNRSGQRRSGDSSGGRRDSSRDGNRNQQRQADRNRNQQRQADRNRNQQRQADRNRNQQRQADRQRDARRDAYRDGRRDQRRADNRRDNRRAYQQRRHGKYHHPQRRYGGRHYTHGHGPRSGHGYFCALHGIFHYYSGYDPFGWLYVNYGWDFYTLAYIGDCDVVSQTFYRRGRRYEEVALLCYDSWGYGYIRPGSRRVYRTY